MLYKYMRKKFGTALYRRGGDILTSLSWTLGSSHANRELTTYNRDDAGNQPTTIEVILTKAACIFEQFIT